MKKTFIYIILIFNIAISIFSVYLIINELLLLSNGLNKTVVEGIFLLIIYSTSAYIYFRFLNPSYQIKQSNYRLLFYTSLIYLLIDYCISFINTPFETFGIIDILNNLITTILMMINPLIIYRIKQKRIKY